MAESTGGEKVLPASPRKILQQREKGNVAKSQDLSAAATLLVALFGLSTLGPVAMKQLLLITRYYFSEIPALLIGMDDIQHMAAEAVLLTVPAVVPMMLLLLAGGILINIAQIGFLMSPQALQPKLEKLNPISGFKRFVSIRSMVELIKSLTKLSVVGYIAWLGLRREIPGVISMINMTPTDSSLAVWGIILMVWWRIVLAMLAIGILDFGYQRWQQGQDLKMTMQEARDELKQLEGDPKVKQRIRQIQRQMAMQRMMGEVPEADVVITNPTTYAVALRYTSDEMAAPVVVAKGARKVAERIREIAIEENVPIVERRELARALYRTIEVGHPVPEDLFRAVAEVLAFVYEIDERETKLEERKRLQPVA